MKAGINRTDTIAGLVILLFAVWYGVASWNLPRVHMADVIDSHIYPMALAGALFLLALGLILGSLKGGETKGWLPGREVVGQLVFLLVALAIYIVLFQSLGYLVSTVLFMVALLKFIDRKRPLWSAVLITLLVSGLCYVVFVHLFRIPIPRGILI